MLAQRLGVIIEGVQKVYAIFLARHGDIAPIGMLFWSRLQRVNSRFLALAHKLEAGTLRPPRPYRPRPGSGVDPAADPATQETAGAPRQKKPFVRDWVWQDPPDPPLSDGMPWNPVPVRLGVLPGWMVMLMGWRVACFGGHLRLLLDEPEMQALLRAAPQAARLLRTVHKMVCLDPLPACLVPPPRRRHEPPSRHHQQPTRPRRGRPAAMIAAGALAPASAEATHAAATGAPSATLVEAEMAEAEIVEAELVEAGIVEAVVPDDILAPAPWPRLPGPPRPSIPPDPPENPAF